MNPELLAHWTRLASQSPQRVAFPEATEEKILLAAQQAQDTGAARCLLVGAEGEIRAAAGSFRVSLEGMELADHTDEDARRRVAAACAGQGVLSESALFRKTRSPLYYAFALQKCGQADCVFAGLSHTTGEVILAASTMIGLAPGISTVSSVGVMDIPGYQGEYGSLLAFADAAVCVDPSPVELADIAISACDTISALMGWPPRCALLSYSTDGSADHPFVTRVTDAVRIAREKRPDLAIDGEFQLDAAICPAVAAKKVRRESPVAGHANIIVYPNINAGNIGVKLVQQFAHADAYGPMLQGFAQPVSDCSRSAPVSELVGNIIMLAVRSLRRNANGQ